MRPFEGCSSRTMGLQDSQNLVTYRDSRLAVEVQTLK